MTHMFKFDRDINPSRLMFDGWYTDRSDAQDVARLVEDERADLVGLIESPTMDYGVLYVLPDSITPERWHFPQHAVFRDAP